jgi:hypothetical protein
MTLSSNNLRFQVSAFRFLFPGLIVTKWAVKEVKPNDLELK